MSDFLKEPLDEKYDNGFLDGLKEARDVARSYRVKMDASKFDLLHALEQLHDNMLKRFNERYEKHE